MTDNTPAEVDMPAPDWAKEKIAALQAEVEQEKAKTAIVEQMRRNAVQGREAAEAKAEVLQAEVERLKAFLEFEEVGTDAADREIAKLQAEVERLKRMNADQDSLLDTRTDELEEAEAMAESYRIERQELGERLGCPPGIRLEQYLEARVRQAAEAEALLNLLRRIQPHLPAIICYASTCGEHEPNQIAVDVDQALAGRR